MWSSQCINHQQSKDDTVLRGLEALNSQYSSQLPCKKTSMCARHHVRNKWQLTFHQGKIDFAWRRRWGPCLNPASAPICQSRKQMEAISESVSIDLVHSCRNLSLSPFSAQTSQGWPYASVKTSLIEASPQIFLQCFSKMRIRSFGTAWVNSAHHPIRHTLHIELDSFITSKLSEWDEP